MTSRSQLINRAKLFQTPSEIWHGMPYEQWDTIHNKLRLIQAQGLECAPVCQGLVPLKFPVILKPIISLAATRQKYRVPFTLNSKPTPGGREFSEKAVAPDWAKNPVLTVCMNSLDYERLVAGSEYAGWFWMPYLDVEDQQRCIELLVHNGRPVFGYSLDYHSNTDIPGALTHISLNTSFRPTVSNIPGWTNILAPTLKGYTGALSLYYIGSYIISANARWTIWSEYIWQSPNTNVSADVSAENNLSTILDQIIRVLGVYTANLEQNASGVCHDLLRQSLGTRVVGLVPLYLKSAGVQELAKRHWQVISRKLGCSLNWITQHGGEGEFMPFAGVLVVNSVDNLKKVNKYKQISQLAAPEQQIPVVY